MEGRKREIGYGLLNFVFWVPMQALIAAALEVLGLLPSRIGIALGWNAE